MTLARSLLLSALLLAFSADAREPVGAPADPRQARLDEALAFIAARAYDLPRVDWPAAERTARETLRTTPGEAGLTAAIRGALTVLADGHSFYRPPRAAASGAPGPQAGRVSARPGIAVLDTTQPIPLLAINGWTGDAAAMRVAAVEVRAALAGAAALSSCGLVLDLRGNSGGNVWRMLAGLAPVFEPGVLQTWVDHDGRETRIGITGGLLQAGGGPHTLAAVPMPAVPAPPRHVAVLYGPRTASSGELLALGFAGVPGVRRFGAPTAGATSANASTHGRDGAVLAVMSSRVRDRTGAMVEGPLLPDEVTDAPLDAARAWLHARCAPPG